MVAGVRGASPAAGRDSFDGLVDSAPMQTPISTWNRPSEWPPQRTIVLGGLYRGGTTMVAGVAHALGLFIGDRLDPRRNNEDLDLQGADAATVLRVARERDAAHDVWGWKDPGVHRTIAEWYARLRNPSFVVTFRDVLAAAQTELRSENFDDLLAAMIQKQQDSTEILAFLHRAKAEGFPVLLVSYERALGNPAALVDGCAEFLGLSPTDAERDAAIRSVDAVRGYGHADGKPPH